LDHKYKRTLSLKEAVEIAFDIKDFDLLKFSDEKYPQAMEIYNGLRSEVEIFQTNSKNSILDILLLPIMKVSEAEATRESLADWFSSHNEPGMAFKICPSRDKTCTIVQNQQAIHLNSVPPLLALANLIYKEHIDDLAPGTKAPSRDYFHFLLQTEYGIASENKRNAIISVIKTISL